MKPALPVLAGLLHAFFHEWLVEQRNASHRTVLAYLLAAYRTRPPRQHRDEELPPGCYPQFLLICCRPGTACGEAMCGGAARSFQASAEESDVLPGVR